MSKAFAFGAVVVVLFAALAASNAGAPTLAVLSGIPAVLIMLAGLVYLVSNSIQMVEASKTKAGRIAVASTLILVFLAVFGTIGWLIALDSGPLPGFCIELKSGGAWCPGR